MKRVLETSRWRRFFRWCKSWVRDQPQTWEIEPWVLRAQEEAYTAIHRYLDGQDVSWKSAIVTIEPQHTALHPEHMTAEEYARSNHGVHMRVVRLKVIIAADDKEYDFFCRLASNAGAWEVQSFQLEYNSVVVDKQIAGANFRMRSRTGPKIAPEKEALAEKTVDKPATTKTTASTSVITPSVTGPIGVVRSVPEKNEDTERAAGQ